MIDIPLMKKLDGTIKRSKSDPLLAFVASPEQDKLDDIRKKNFEEFVSVCKKYKIRYVYLGHEEICGCEDKKSKTGWPAMWAVASDMGYPGCCGNSDQYQVNDSLGLYYLPEAYGYWDLNEIRKLTKDEAKKLKFRHVVNR